MAILRTIILALLLMSSAAFGQRSPAIDPPDPTSKDPVTLLVQQVDSCPPPPAVSRSGFEIKVTVNFGQCLFPPSLITHHVELGVLPAGQYNVVVYYAGSQQPVAFSFTVLEASLSVSVEPYLGSTEGGTIVDVNILGAFCINQTPCPAPTITFDGVPGTVLQFESVHLRAKTPPHATGAVDVRVTASNVNSSYAFRYYDRGAPPSSVFFEKVLIPVILNGPGALGSNWVTEIFMRNDNAYFVELWRPIAGSSAVTPSTPLSFGSATNSPGGIFLIAPREAATALKFHAMVRDTSRGDIEWGTQIPIVRETSFVSQIDLLDIPVDQRFRTMLRIYSLQPVAPTATIGLTVYSLDDGKDVRHFLWPMSVPTACTDATSCADKPGYAAISDLTSGVSAPRIGVRVDAYTAIKVWAFATVTNNNTQHVTVISPE